MVGYDQGMSQPTSQTGQSVVDPSSMIVDLVHNTNTHASNTKPWLWKPGQSGNPRGRPAVGASYKEWLGSLDTEADDDGLAKYDEAALEAIRDDPALTRAKRGAARDLLGMLNGEYSRSGIPHMANHRDAILDRTVGKPTQTMVVAQVEVEPTDLLGELRAMLVGDAQLLEAVKAQADRAALPILEGEVVQEGPGGAQEGTGDGNEVPSS